MTLAPRPLNNIKISPARPEDAAAFIDLQKKLAEESSFLLLEMQEINNNVEKQAAMLSEYAKEDSLTKVLLAYADNTLVGYMGYRSFPLKKIKHNVKDIAIGILKEYQRQGVAQKLFLNAENNWRNTEIKIARLAVITTNEKAISLYRKIGFTAEGVEHKSLYINGAYVDQLVMSKEII